MVRTTGPLFSPNVSGPLKRRVRKKYPEPPPPPCDLEVTGTLTPDITGCFIETGVHNGKPYYKHRELNWFIWYDSSGEPATYAWHISETLGAPYVFGWHKMTAAYEPPPGDYTPIGGTVGTATVAVP